MATMTLKGIFEREAAHMHVIVLQGDDARDAHACLDKRYIMLPGGESENTTYAAGLHELGHLAAPPTDDEVTAKYWVKVTPLVPPRLYARTLNAERRAWDWALSRLEGADNYGELMVALTADRTFTLKTYEDGEAANRVRWDAEVEKTYAEFGEAGQPKARAEAERLTELIAVMYVSLQQTLATAQGHVGCGECEGCKRNSERDERAAKLYEEACRGQQSKRTPQ